MANQNKNKLYLKIVLVVIMIGIALFYIINTSMYSPAENFAKDPFSSEFDNNHQTFDDPVSLGVEEDTNKGGIVSSAINNIKTAYNNYKVPDIIKNSSSILYKKSILVIGGYDGSVKVIKPNKETKVFALHNKQVNSLSISDNKLISSSDDGSLAIINLDTLKVVKIIKGHYGAVESIASFDNKIFSISKDYSIKMWELDSAGLTRIIDFK